MSCSVPTLTAPTIGTIYYPIADQAYNLEVTLDAFSYTPNDNVW